MALIPSIHWGQNFDKTTEFRIHPEVKTGKYIENSNKYERTVIYHVVPTTTTLVPYFAPK